MSKHFYCDKVLTILVGWKYIYSTLKKCLDDTQFFDFWFTKLTYRFDLFLSSNKVAHKFQLNVWLGYFLINLSFIHLSEFTWLHRQKGISVVWYLWRTVNLEYCEIQYNGRIKGTSCPYFFQWLLAYLKRQKVDYFTCQNGLWKACIRTQNVT